MAPAAFSSVSNLPNAIPVDARVERVAMMAPALATIAVGFFVIFCVGFLQASAVHNGTHDTRHANGFPCH